ncbi:MAG: UDP-glucose 4-epimerase GalE [Candidatus Gracilibacteria bacterium]|jgi:UDP-glucose 4-epimerase
MAKILVTGGAGYIGSHAVKALVEKGYDVVVVDNLSKGHKEAVERAAKAGGGKAGVSAKFVQLDLSDSAALQKVFAENEIDAVLHFAGSIEVGQSMKIPEKYFENNTVNGVRLLEAMRSAGDAIGGARPVKKIIFSSTAAVYGNPVHVPILETDPLNPTNFYGQSKLFFEQILQKYADFYGFNFVALRYFNACGADSSGEIGQDYEPSTHILPRIMQALTGKIGDLKLFGTDYPTADGTCIRDYIHVTDLVDAHVLALDYLFKKGQTDANEGSGVSDQNGTQVSGGVASNGGVEKGSGEIFNLGNGSGFSVREVLKVAEQVTGKKIAIEEGPRREGDPAVLVADSTKARKVLGWNPRLNKLEDIIATAWKWHENHPNGYGNK